MATKKCKRKEWKHVIYSDDSSQYDEFEKAWREDTGPANYPDGDVPEYTWEMFGDDLNDWLADERMNLNWQIEGEIVAIASLGLWHGRRLGYKMVGDKLSDIFNCSQDENEYYCDQDDVQATCSHHDGTNYITYRVIKPGDGEKVEELLDKMAFESDDYEADVYRATHSLVPYVADIFGWKYDRRMKRGDMWNPRTYKSYRKAA